MTITRMAPTTLMVVQIKATLTVVVGRWVPVGKWVVTAVRHTLEVLEKCPVVTSLVIIISLSKRHAATSIINLILVYPHNISYNNCCNNTVV